MSLSDLDSLDYFRINHIQAVKIAEVRVPFHPVIDYMERCPYCNKLLREGDSVTKVKVKTSKVVVKLPLAFHAECIVKVMKVDSRFNNPSKEEGKDATQMLCVQKCPESIFDEDWND